LVDPAKWEDPISWADSKTPTGPERPERPENDILDDDLLACSSTRPSNRMVSVASYQTRYDRPPSTVDRGTFAQVMVAPGLSLRLSKGKGSSSAGSAKLVTGTRND